MTNKAELFASLPPYETDTPEKFQEIMKVIQGYMDTERDAPFLGSVGFGPVYTAKTSAGIDCKVSTIFKTDNTKKIAQYTLLVTDENNRYLGHRKSRVNEKGEVHGPILSAIRGVGIASVIESANHDFLQRLAFTEGRSLTWKIDNQNAAQLMLARAMGNTTQINNKAREQERWKHLYFDILGFDQNHMEKKFEGKRSIVSLFPNRLRMLHQSVDLVRSEKGVHQPILKVRGKRTFPEKAGREFFTHTLPTANTSLLNVRPV